MSVATFAQDLEEAAAEAAGNHLQFESFGWHTRPEDDHNWTIVYTHNRDSGLLDISNAEAIAKEMEVEEFEEDVVSESHNHWAVGWVDGYSIRVYDKDGRITAAFLKWFDLNSRVEDYPILDEEDYSQKEYDATLENISNNSPRNLLIDLPEGWEGEVFSWLWDNNQSAVENRDDQGGYADEDEIIEALLGLGMITEKDIEE